MVLLQVQKEAVQSVEQDGMVFIDEIDKIVVGSEMRYGKCLQSGQAYNMHASSCSSAVVLPPPLPLRLLLLSKANCSMSESVYNNDSRRMANKTLIFLFATLLHATIC